MYSFSTTFRNIINKIMRAKFPSYLRQNSSSQLFQILLVKYEISFPCRERENPSSYFTPSRPITMKLCCASTIAYVHNCGLHVCTWQSPNVAAYVHIYDRLSCTTYSNVCNTKITTGFLPQLAIRQRVLQNKRQY